MDNRGQSIGIGRFLLALLVGTIMYWVVDLTTEPMLQGSYNATNNATANQATQWFETGINALPIAIALIAFISLIALSVFQREVLR